MFRDIYDTVVELRSDQATVIRTFDFFSGPLADWREVGIEPAGTADWEAQAEAIHEAADEYDAFNGTNHDEDPRAGLAGDWWPAENVSDRDHNPKGIAMPFHRHGPVPSIRQTLKRKKIRSPSLTM